MTMIERYKQKLSRQNALNRKAGEKFEIKLLNKFKKRSDVLYAIHSAGSYGLFDLVVLMMDGTRRFISAKISGYHDPKERTEIYKFMQKTKKMKVKIEVWYYKSKRKIGHYKVTEENFDCLQKTFYQNEWTKGKYNA